MRRSLVIAVLAAVGCGGNSADNECERIVASLLKPAPTSRPEHERKGMEDYLMSGCTNMSKTERACLHDVDFTKTSTKTDKCLEVLDHKATKREAFDRYLTQGKETEARVFVKALYDNARRYYTDRPSAGPTAQFPEPSVGPTPPVGSCCQGHDNGCPPNVELWDEPTWIALGFSVVDPHFYSYAYEVDNEAKEFTVSAYGDLDCDGVYSTYSMTGRIDAQHPDDPGGDAELVIDKPLE